MSSNRTSSKMEEEHFEFADSKSDSKINETTTTKNFIHREIDRQNVNLKSSTGNHNTDKSNPEEEPLIANDNVQNKQKQIIDSDSETVFINNEDDDRKLKFKFVT
jgi:hypothetical protein